MLLGKEIGDIAEETLRFFRQTGVEAVGMPTRYTLEAGTRPTVRPLVPPPQQGPLSAMPSPWELAALRKIKERIERFGFSVTTINLPLSGNIVMGKNGRDADIETVQTNIRTAAQLGMPVLTYNFTALRASKGYGARRPDMANGRGATLRDFDAARIRNLPPLPTVGEHSLDEMWARIEYFLRAVVPVAAEHNVRLAVHPNDPPVALYRGVAQPLATLAGLQRLLDVVDSPANALFFDTGVTTEMGEDAVAAIKHFGLRIAAVHFRNVRVVEPYNSYVETFHDNGDCDMAGCMRALREAGYRGAIYPDHTPHIDGDGVETRAGWALALGLMRGWMSC